MEYIGDLYFGEEKYLLRWVTNKTSNKFLIYSQYTAKDYENILEGKSAEDMVLEVTTLGYMKKFNFEEYILAGAIATKTGVLKSTYGDTTLMQKFIDEYSKLCKREWNLAEVSTEKIGLDKYTYRKSNDFEYITKETLKGIESITLKTDKMSFSTGFFTKKATVKGVEDIEWRSLDIFTPTALREKFKLLGARTLEELRSLKNGLEWYYGKGNKPIKDYRVLHTQEDVDKVCKVLKMCYDKGIVVAMDTETTGLEVCDISDDNPIKKKIVGMSLSWKDHQGIYIPFRHTEFENCDLRTTMDKLKWYLENCKLLAHNGLFDGKVFLDVGFELYEKPIVANIVEDTRIMNFNLNSTASKGHNGLKEITHKLLGWETVELSDIFRKKADAGLFKYLTEDIVKIYACCDTDALRMVWKKLRVQLHPKGISPYQLDCEVQKNLFRGEYVGNGVDMDLLREMEFHNDNDLETLKELMFKFVGQIGGLTQYTKMYSDKVYKKQMTQEEMQEKLKEYTESEEYKNARYEFNPGSTEDLKDIMYLLLQYPVLRVTQPSGQPSVDKFTLDDLAVYEADFEGNYLKDDVYSSIKGTLLEDKNKKGNILIDKGEFNTRKYPFVLILKKWRQLEKLRTAFFNPLSSGNLEGRYFAPFQMCNAETGRITNRVQTLIGSLKKLIVPISTGDYYLGVWDFAQIEYRCVAGLSGDTGLVDKLRNPRADYHREGGAEFFEVEPWQITSKERKKLKVVNFAKLYKMGDSSLSTSLFGRTYDPEQKRKNLIEASFISNRWEKVNFREKLYLDAYSKFAVETGYVENVEGRRRYFNMENLTPAMIAKIERMAGNYPIQSYAAELFKKAFVRICKRIKKEGLEDKVIITMLIHDEMVASVHKSVNPYFLYKMIVEECMIEIEGHPRYYAGISICDNWHEGKDDLYEAPIEFVMDKIAEPENMQYDENYWCDDAKTRVVNDIKEYMRKVYIKELSELAEEHGQPLTPKDFNLEVLMSKFTDYFLKTRINLYIGQYRKTKEILDSEGKKDKDAMAEDAVMAAIEKLFMDEWGVEVLNVKYPGEPYKIVRKVVDVVESQGMFEKFLDKSEKEEELLDMLDFDELFSDDEEGEDVEISIPVNTGIGNTKDTFKIKKKNTGQGGRLCDFIDFGVDKKFYGENEKLVTIVDDKLVINVNGMSVENYKKLCSYLVNKQDSKGYPVVFLKDKERLETSLKVKNINLEDLSSATGDSFILSQI